MNILLIISLAAIVVQCILLYLAYKKKRTKTVFIVVAIAFIIMILSIALPFPDYIWAATILLALFMWIFIVTIRNR